MNLQETPIEFIQKYYEKRIERRKLFPEARLFYEAQLKYVAGKRIINIGCGPQFYDDLQHFRELPEEYLGLDISPQNFKFLKYSIYSELLKGKKIVENGKIKVKFVCDDILDPAIHLNSIFTNTDCVVSVGFLGIFTEERFKIAIRNICHWLNPGGRLVNLSWCGNFQERKLYQERLRYQFNHPDNPEHDDIVLWTQQAGLRLVNESLFKIPNKAEYGWSTISACVFEKPG